MKKTMTATLLGSTVFLTACVDTSNEAPKEATHIYSKQCLQGVVYWKGLKKLAPVFKPDSTVETCSQDTENTKK